ncbi:MAG: hypothetical protein Harvfovirus72_1 [Harvfovirus sp.]|uniref:Post-SET domain-containing protein n=1 Tax=Harvfovirus sp. TaxID=2487768 RepID=A0A3G5A3T9_9VIRU|nr:MAG: hypothetical protein Harvfovirus72_1 [Harvfovirus sp.]
MGEWLVKRVVYLQAAVRNKETLAAWSDLRRMGEEEMASVESEAELVYYDRFTKGAYSRNIFNVTKWREEAGVAGDVLVLHAINCNCGLETCLGYLFVKESECPLCKECATPLVNHFDHLTPKQMEGHLERWAKQMEKEIDDKMIVLEEDSDYDEDDDQSHKLVQNPQQ